LVNGVLHLGLGGWSKLLALSGSLDIALPLGGRAPLDGALE
jgi:hypothetical protein